MAEIKNYYAHIKKDKLDVDRSYPNESILNISLPARILICAPSDTGKTNLLRNLLDLIGAFDKIILWAKDLDEPLYKDLIEKCRKVEKKFKKQILLAITESKDLPNIDTDIDRTENTVLICDDLITEDKKSLAKLDPYFVRGRKMGVSMLFLTQGYFNVPPMIRKNSNYVILKKIKNIKDLNRIIREYALDVSKDELMEMYKYAMRGDPHTSFFMLDAKTKDPNLMYRANFEPIPR